MCVTNKIQDVCTSINASVDRQSSERQFRFNSQSIVVSSAVRNDEEEEAGYCSVDDDVAFLFATNDGEYMAYYGNIAEMHVHSKSAAGKNKARRVGSLHTKDSKGTITCACVHIHTYAPCCWFVNIVLLRAFKQIHAFSHTQTQVQS